jgi:hypothetical protein
MRLGRWLNATPTALTAPSASTPPTAPFVAAALMPIATPTPGGSGMRFAALPLPGAVVRSGDGWVCDQRSAGVCGWDEFVSGVFWGEGGWIRKIVVRGYPDPKNTNGCGNYNSVNFHFQLSSDAPCDGYLIQKVTLTCVLKDCRKKSQPCRFDISEKWPGRNVTFYEAWFIPERKRTPKGFTEIQHNDSSNLVFEDGFCGTINVTTELRFFCKKQWVDVGGYGPNTDEAMRPQPPVYKWRWAPRQVFHPRGAESLCSMTSIDLPATPDGPEARDKWDGTPAIEQGAGRSHTISFNCCDDCQTDRFGNPSEKWVSSTWSASTDWVDDLVHTNFETGVGVK